MESRQCNVAREAILDNTRSFGENRMDTWNKKERAFKEFSLRCM